MISNYCKNSNEKKTKKINGEKYLITKIGAPRKFAEDNKKLKFISECPHILSADLFYMKYIATKMKTQENDLKNFLTTDKMRANRTFGSTIVLE